MFRSHAESRMERLAEKFSSSEDMSNEEIIETLAEDVTELRKKLRRSGGLNPTDIVIMRLYDALNTTETWIQEEGKTSPESSISPGLFEGELPGEFSALTFILSQLSSIVIHPCRCQHCNKNRGNAASALAWLVAKMGDKMPELPSDFIEDLRQVSSRLRDD